MITRLLVANRGEIALRIVRACREAGIESVAVYSDADRRAPHVLSADRAVRLGPPPAAESYLNIDRVLSAVRESQADAVHPGYGFLSERAAFAQACEDAGLTFVGPPAAALERMGSKIGARRLMEQAGVPIVPGESPADQSDAAIKDAVIRIGLPALIKPSAGGGGIGMKTVRAADDVDEAIQRARREATAAFGDGTLYIERLIERPRHVEIQILADRQGHIVHLFERECSIQRRHQKTIEESPCPVLTPRLRARMGQAAVTAAAAAQYVNAGTVEFLLAGTGDNAEFFFLEMNTRLQVEHPVTEAVVGVDLVQAQLAIASGAPLPWSQDALSQRGHAIECRIYAEDPQQGFLPQAGTLATYREPRGPGIRVDSGVVEGSDVPVYYDPLLAKLIVSAETRKAAIRRALVALPNYAIEGIATNIPFLIAVLQHPRFAAGDIDTHFLDTELRTLLASAPSAPSAPPAPPAPSKPRDPFVALPGWGRREERDEASGFSQRRFLHTSPSVRRKSDAAGQLSAPMPATVVRVLVSPGDAVRKGDTLVTLEAMKMELAIRAPRDGVVARVNCKAGELVQPETNLLELGA